jgi:hypothetical protein
MKIRPVGAELLHTDGGMERRDVANSHLTLKRPPGVKYDPKLRSFYSDNFLGVSYKDTNIRDLVTTSVL